MANQPQSSRPERPTALVTGASSGIGLDLARILAEHGHDLVLVARSAGTLEQIAAELSSRHGISATALPTDLSDPGAPRALYDLLAARGVVVDILINNAGFGLLGRFDQSDERRLLEMIQVNVAALTELTRLFLPGMIQRNRGRIMNVASTAAFQPGPLMAVYYATKAYVLSLTEAIADELRDTNVTLTTLCPGPTRTNFGVVAHMLETHLAHTPFMMTSEEVARQGYAAMMRGKRTVVTGRFNRLGAFSTRLVPRRLATRIAGMMQERRG